MAPSTMVIRSKIVAGMRRSGEARARPSDDGCVQPRRRPHTEVRRVSTAVTTLCRGARNTANHQTGRYPPYQWFNRESATCASRQRALKLACRIFCCKRLALKDNDTVWYPALYHQRPNSRRGRRRLGDIHGHEAKSYLVIGHLRGEGSSRCR